MEILSIIQFLDGGFCVQSKAIWQFLGQIVNIMQIAIPVIIILLGTLDLGKAVMAGDDKKIKEAQKMLIMRLVYGVAVFFVITIVQVIFSLVSTGTGKGEKPDTASTCFKCVASPTSSECVSAS